MLHAIVHVITNRLNHRLWRCDRKRFDRSGVEKSRKIGSHLWGTGWPEKERAYARMEKNKATSLGIVFTISSSFPSTGRSRYLEDFVKR